MPPRNSNELTPRQSAFVQEYLVDLCATQAAVRAGYSAKTAEQQGARLLGNVKVSAAVTAAQADRSKRTAITADGVLRRLWTIATADPRELIAYRRRCCRYCYGLEHRYQSTPAELARDRAAWEVKQTKASKEVFDERGGTGFNARREPHPDCPECHGDGDADVFVRDTRHLSPAAVMLYAGVKAGKDGMIEVKLVDQQEALVNVARHLGLFDPDSSNGKDPKEAAADVRAFARALAQQDGMSA